MIETISKKVAPENENKLITVMSNFGWSFKSSQEINSAESHLEGIGDTVYSVTTRENYVKLVFQRDTTMPNYARIKELETKYTNIVASEPNAPHFGAIDVFICFIGFIGLYNCSMGTKSAFKTNCFWKIIKYASIGDNRCTVT